MPRPDARIGWRAGIGLGLLGLGACASGTSIPVEELRPAPGFAVSLFAVVPGATSLSAAADGSVHVATRDGEIFLLQDTDRDGVADLASRRAHGLAPPLGVTRAPDGGLVVAEGDRVVRFEPEGEVAAVVPKGVLPEPAGADGRHIAFGPDGRLYLALGMPCPTCPLRGFAGTIVQMRPDGHEFQIQARGVRSAGGFDWHPRTKALLFTNDVAGTIPGATDVSGLYRLPDPPVASIGVIDEISEAEPLPADLAPILAWTFEPGLAATSIDVYGGNGFPARLWTAALLALAPPEGSLAPVEPRLVAIRLTRDAEADGEEVLLRGWAGRDGRVWGRPVDLEELPDGSVLIADDVAGAVYRLTSGF